MEIENVHVLDEVHCWDFLQELIRFFYVKLHSSFHKELLLKALNHFGSRKNIAEFLNDKAKKYGLERKYNTYSVSQWLGVVSRRSYFLPLFGVIELAKELNIMLEHVEANIKLVEYYGGHFKIKIKLPIQVTPEFVSTVGHLLGDGFVPPRNVSSVTSTYKQYTEQALRNFKQKIKNVFGEYKDKCRSKIHINIPRIFVRIISDYFKIITFYGDSSRIPNIIKNMPNEFKLAFLIAFIVDEGTIDQSRIALFSGNKFLLEDVQELAVSLGFKSSDVRIYHPGEFVFNIYMFSAKKLLKETNNLSQIFPTCNLCHKQAELERIVEIQERGWNRRAEGESKRLILDKLKTDSQTSDELSYKLLLSPATIRYHLRKLKEDGKVESVGVQERAVLWGLK